MKCEECKWFYYQAAGDDIGFCRRYPPTAPPTEDEEGLYGERMHTLVFSDDWCGEFVSKEKP